MSSLGNFDGSLVPSAAVMLGRPSSGRLAWRVEGSGTSKVAANDRLDSNFHRLDSQGRRYVFTYHELMESTIGSTTQDHVERVPGSLLKMARARAGLTQRQVAQRAGVPQSMIARIETHRVQPSFPLLYQILVRGTGLEPRIRLEPFDDHDTVVDALVATDPAGTATAKQAQRNG